MSSDPARRGNLGHRRIEPDEGEGRKIRNHLSASEDPSRRRRAGAGDPAKEIGRSFHLPRTQRMFEYDGEMWSKILVIIVTLNWSCKSRTRELPPPHPVNREKPVTKRVFVCGSTKTIGTRWPSLPVRSANLPARDAKLVQQLQLPPKVRARDFAAQQLPIL